MQQVKDFLFITLTLVTAQVIVAVWFDPEIMVKKLNRYRLRHKAGQLDLDDKLILNSMNVALNLINNRNIPRNIDEYGMSVYWFQNLDVVTENVETAIKIATETWYGEGKQYDYTSEPLDKESTKNFTQILWKETKTVGTGIWANNEKAVVVVLYSPKGNQTNQYVQNVDSPVERKRVNHVTI